MVNKSFLISEFFFFTATLRKVMSSKCCMKWAKKRSGFCKFEKISLRERESEREERIHSLNVNHRKVMNVHREFKIVCKGWMKYSYWKKLMCTKKVFSQVLFPLVGF